MNNNERFTLDSVDYNDDNGKKSEPQVTDSDKFDVFELAAAVDDLTSKYVILYASLNKEPCKCQ